MLKLIKADRISGVEPDAEDGTIRGYMKDSGYTLTSGAELIASDRAWIFELDTPILGHEDAAADLARLVTESEVYHPIPVEGFGGRMVSRPSVDRANLVTEFLLESGVTGTMLDVGCHYGYLAFTFDAYGLDVDAIDPQEKVIQVSRLISRILNSSVDFQCCDLFDLYSSHRTYSMVLAMNVLHYVLGEQNSTRAKEAMTLLGQLTKDWLIISYPSAVEDMELWLEYGVFARMQLIGKPSSSYEIYALSKKQSPVGIHPLDREIHSAGCLSG